MRWSDFSRKARNVFDRHVKKIIIAAVFAVSLFFILESKRLSGLPSAAQDSWTIGILLDLGTGALVSVLIFIAFDQIYQNVGRLNRLSRQPDFDYMHLLNHEFPKFKSANHRKRSRLWITGSPFSGIIQMRGKPSNPGRSLKRCWRRSTRH